MAPNLQEFFREELVRLRMAAGIPAYKFCVNFVEIEGCYFLITLPEIPNERASNQPA